MPFFERVEIVYESIWRVLVCRFSLVRRDLLDTSLIQRHLWVAIFLFRLSILSFHIVQFDVLPVPAQDS